MPKQLVSAENIITGSLKNYQKNWLVYAEFGVWFALMFVVTWAFTQISLTVADKALRFFCYIMFSLPMGVILIILSVALIDMIGKNLQKKKADFRSSLFQGLHHLFPFIWVVILSGLVTSLGLILLVIPGVIFYFWYRFSAYELIVNDTRGTAALAASRKSVTGRWWDVFIRVALPVIFFYLATRLVLLLSYLFFGAVLGDPGLFFRTAVTPESVPAVQSLLNDLIPRTVQALSMPLFVAADLILWFDLKRAD